MFMQALLSENFKRWYVDDCHMVMGREQEKDQWTTEVEKGSSSSFSPKWKKSLQRNIRDAWRVVLPSKEALNCSFKKSSA